MSTRPKIECNGVIREVECNGGIRVPFHFLCLRGTRGHPSGLCPMHRRAVERGEAIHPEEYRKDGAPAAGPGAQVMRCEACGADVRVWSSDEDGDDVTCGYQPQSPPRHLPEGETRCLMCGAARGELGVC